jgi:bifunctional UDP-N-acetylglucosamine pyrophosphorylase/glucosamine-1-phosphate N-acetyltransferase
MPIPFVAIVLAAGQGTRMKGSLPKVLHRVAGVPMYAHVVEAALEAGARHVVLVVGHGREAVEADVQDRFDGRVITALQAAQRGTGDAARVGLDALPDFDGWAVVLCGDTPLVTPALIRTLAEDAEDASGPLTMLTSEVDNPAGYGRILRSRGGLVVGVREEKDASLDERALREVNPGVYAVSAPFLRAAVARLSTDNAQGELYLTDVVAQAARSGGVSAIAWNAEETRGINDRAQLAQCEAAMRLRIAYGLARSGVTVRDPHTTYVDRGVVVEADATLEPNVHLRGATVIAKGAQVSTGCVLTDVRVQEGASLKPYTVASDCVIGEQAETGPFAHVRPGSQMEKGSRIGNFVEIKNVRLGPGSKANHLAYLGDGDIEENVNVGAGTIFCNYDGFNKHRTVLEAGCFIGSDSQLVAPVRVGRGAYVATGTTVTSDVPADALAISRTRQENKLGYASRLKARFKALKEAGKKG